MDDVYADNAEEIIALKSSQSAFSEWLVNTMFWIVDSNKGNTYFAFPSMSDCGIFVQGRVDKAADETPYLGSQLRGKTDNVKLKRFNYRNMYFTGTQKRTQIISSPADITLEDEYDEHNPDVHDTVEKRLNNSKLKWKRRISTPTVPDFGIHQKWNESDQRCWHMKCSYCKKEIKISGDDFGNRWQDFICDNPLTGKKAYCCPECKSLQFIPSSSEGYWKVTYPDRVIHGYSVNRIMTKTCSAQNLWDAYQQSLRNDTVAEFYRSDLGCPFQPKGSRIYPNDIIACASADIYPCIKAGVPGKDYFIGADTGKKIHATVMDIHQEKPRIVFAEVLDKYEDIERLIDLFNPKAVVIDNRPEPTPVANLRRKYPIVYGAEHNTGINKATALIKEKDEFIGVSYNRYFAIERFYNFITNKTIGIPIDINDLTDQDFHRHLCTFMRIEKINESGDKIRTFVSTTGKKQPDHFLFSSMYALTAWDAYKEIQRLTPLEDSGFLIL